MTLGQALLGLRYGNTQFSSLQNCICWQTFANVKKIHISVKEPEMKKKRKELYFPQLLKFNTAKYVTFC